MWPHLTGEVDGLNNLKSTLPRVASTQVEIGSVVQEKNFKIAQMVLYCRDLYSEKILFFIVCKNPISQADLHVVIFLKGNRFCLNKNDVKMRGKRNRRCTIQLRGE